MKPYTHKQQKPTQYVAYIHIYAYIYVCNSNKLRKRGHQLESGVPGRSLKEGSWGVNGMEIREQNRHNSISIKNIIK